jgi:hypothetical protein
MKHQSKIVLFSLLINCASAFSMEPEQFNKKFKQLEAKIANISQEKDFHKALESYFLSINALKEFIAAAPTADFKEALIEKLLSIHVIILKRIAENLDAKIDPILYTTQAKQDLVEFVKAGYPLMPQSDTLAQLKNEILGYSLIIEASRPLIFAMAHWTTKNFHSLSQDLKDAIYTFYFLDTPTTEQKKLANKRLAYAFDLLIKLDWNNNLKDEAKMFGMQAERAMKIIKEEQMIDTNSTGYKNLMITLDKLKNQ